MIQYYYAMVITYCDCKKNPKVNLCFQYRGLILPFV